MKYSITTTRVAVCAMLTVLLLGLFGCEKKKRRGARSSGNSSEETTTPTSTDPNAAKPSPEEIEEALSVATAPELTDYRTPPGTSGITLAVQCNTAGTLSILDNSGAVLTETTATSPITKCILPQHVEGAVKFRFEPADGSPGTQRFIMLPMGENLVIRRLIAPTEGKGWTVENVAEKAVDKSDENVAQIKPKVEPQPTPEPTPPQPVAKSSLDDWIAAQAWFKKLASQMPSGVNLSTSISPGEKPGYRLLQIREVHTPGSGLDPNVSPLIATFRISSNRQTTEWSDPLSGDWSSLSDFYKSRNSDPEPPVAPIKNISSQPNRPTTPDTFSSYKLTSLWDHNGSTMGLLTNGNKRAIVYVRVRKGLIGLVEPGTVLFDGYTKGGKYIGKANRFSKGLPAIQYNVTGPILKNGSEILLKGKAPIRNTNGEIYKYIDDRLQFSYQKLAP